ncbi:hypothetical protein SAMN06298212_12119 [Ruaniaceae bacterium KH17]|nr:hypothetical protein SAMN06298212_12119 [Ruaniaceae bacterium KH17]
MIDEQKLRQALAWTGGGAIAIGLVQLMLASSGSVTTRLWIMIGTSFVGQLLALVAAVIVLRSLLGDKDCEGAAARIKRCMVIGGYVLLAALAVGIAVGTIQMDLIEGLVAGGIGTVLGLQGLAAIWIAERILTGKQV